MTRRLLHVLRREHPAHLRSRQRQQADLDTDPVTMKDRRSSDRDTNPERRTPVTRHQIDELRVMPQPPLDAIPERLQDEVTGDESGQTRRCQNGEEEQQRNVVGHHPPTVSDAGPQT